MIDDDDPSPMSAEERAEHLERIKARIKASIEDPRPTISMEEFDQWLEQLLEDDRRLSGDAAA